MYPVYTIDFHYILHFHIYIIKNKYKKQKKEKR